MSASSALALGAASVNAQTPSWSMYQPYTNSTFVPFVSALSSTQGALVNLAVGPSGNMSSLQAVTMDTGSIGIQVSADNWNPGSLTPIGPGSVTLNSSGVTNSGNFYSVPVNFFNGGTNVATANVPVLVVTQSVTCPPGGGSCTTNNDPRGVFYMGVGLNRTAGENIHGELLRRAQNTCSKSAAQESAALVDCRISSVAGFIGIPISWPHRFLSKHSSSSPRDRRL